MPSKFSAASPQAAALHSALPAWRALAVHRQALAGTSIARLFAGDPSRAKAFSREHEGLFFDFSKQGITRETLSLLEALARECDLEGWREKLFTGAPVNGTENRAALHTALRGGDECPHAGEIAQTLKAVQAASEKVRGARSVRAVITIGIGGSDSGPHLASSALKAYAREGLSLRFLSNIDPGHFTETLAGLKPEEAVFIISSKSFTTQETCANAEAARDWAQGAAGWEERFWAVTGNRPAALAFGLREDHILPLPDWVGGRYSLWSAIGLPVACAIGFEAFSDMLKGARSADTHFRTRPLLENIPVLMGLLGVWQRNFEERPAMAVLPYDQRLALLPRIVQQVEMESNGKGVTREGRVLDYPAAPVVFGEVGTVGQHAFYQLLHQGDPVVPCDFIITAKGLPGPAGHHDKLAANALAQAQALAFGYENKAEPHRNFPGNRPSTTILMPDVTPYTLGMLLAFYEHKTFVQGVLWGVNSFDQWGVELGKQLTGPILKGLESGKGAGEIPSLDPSTQTLMEKILKMA